LEPKRRDSQISALHSRIRAASSDTHAFARVLCRCSIVEHSPAEALKRGGVGLRLPLAHLLSHHAVAELTQGNAAWSDGRLGEATA